MLAAAFNCPTFSDYTVVNSGNSIKIYLHRVVLDTIPYFRSLFNSRTKEVLNGSLQLSSEKFLLAEKILRFLYTRRIPNGASMKPVEWLDLLAFAEMWQYHDFITTCIHVVIRLMIDDWKRDLTSLQDLMHDKYQNIIGWFLNDQIFLESILKFFITNPIPQEIWSIVTHPKYPFNEVLRSGSGYVLVEWLKSHSITQEEALGLGLLLPFHDPVPTCGILDNYVERPMTPNYEEEDAYYDQYPDSP